jgi:hypothetical protein
MMNGNPSFVWILEILEDGGSGFIHPSSHRQGTKPFLLDGGEPCDEMTNLADDEGGAMFEEEGHVGHPTINRSNNLLGYSGLCCGTNIAANSHGVDRSTRLFPGNSIGSIIVQCTGYRPI